MLDSMAADFQPGRMRRYLLPLTMLMCAPAMAQTLVIENVHLVPLDRKIVLHDYAVIVDQDRIAALMPMAEYSPAPETERVDGRGGYLMPGLVDSHVHLEEYMDARPDFGDAPVFLRHGITAVFNLRGFPEHLLLRERIAAGELLAPTLYTSGEFINEPRVNTPEEAEAEVRAQAEAGYDIIKFREVVEHGVGVLTTHGVDHATFRAIHDTARAIGIPVLGHAPHGLGLAAVLETGHTLAHVGELVQLHFFPRWPPAGLRVYLMALLAMAAIVLGALIWRLLSRRPTLPGARQLLGGSALTLLLASAMLALMAMLLPGGLTFGNWMLIGLLGLLSILLVVLGLWHALRALIPAGDAGPPLRVGLLVIALCGLLTGGLGLVRGLPIALRATTGEMQRVAVELARSGAHLCTTLVIYDELITLRKTGGETRISPDIADSLTADFRERYLRARDFLSAWRWSGLLSPDGLLVRYNDFTRELTGTLHRAGVPLLAGTDAFGVVLAPPGPTMHVELELLVEAGLSPYEALRSATIEPARFLDRQHEFGTISPGLRADLVLLAANPLADIGAIREPLGVVLRGRWLSREALDVMLAALD
jgi:imidazolonepropionase-like amidohydrolase